MRVRLTAGGYTAPVGLFGSITTSTRVRALTKFAGDRDREANRYLDPSGNSGAGRQSSQGSPCTTGTSVKAPALLALIDQRVQGQFDPFRGSGRDEHALRRNGHASCRVIGRDSFSSGSIPAEGT